MKQLKILTLLFFFAGWCSDAFCSLVINEFLADPPVGLLGDANRDGIRDALADEFVELLNTGNVAIDLSHWTLSDQTKIRHEFVAGSMIMGHQYFVVFGGGNPSALAQALTASIGQLSLNNGGDQIILKNQLGIVIHSLTYGKEADQEQSLTRFPEGSGSFAFHSTISKTGALYSPGNPASSPLSENMVETPELATAVYFLLALFLTMGLRCWPKERRHPFAI